MTGDFEEQEVKDKLNLIENMIAELVGVQPQAGAGRFCSGVWPITSPLPGPPGAAAPSRGR